MTKYAGFNSLLSYNNTKIDKSNNAGTKYYTVILQLAPHKLSGNNICSSATAGCISACINKSGFGNYPAVQKTRIARTKLFFEDRKLFREILFSELNSYNKWCKKNNKQLAVRLNGYSDLKWEELMPDIFSTFNDCTFYDYTKIFKRMIKCCEGKNWPANYKLTFSRSETNHDKCMEILRLGGNVAVVFRNKLPNRWEGYKVINSDKNDLRFLDPKNVICGLKAKGRGRKDNTQFVVDV